MSQEVTKIKARIKSVSGALKVTSAMKLVSTVKLKRWKNKMMANRLYFSKINEITDEVLMWVKKTNNPFTHINEESDKNLYIVVSSTLGLCGSYNMNIFKVSDAKIKENDAAIILGNKGIVHYENESFEKIEDFASYHSIEDASLIRKLTEYVINEYSKGTYKEIHLIYSEYKNSLAFVPKDFLILPFNKEVKEENGYAPILEPDKESLVNEIIPLYLKTSIYSKLLEAEVCEQAARSNAMENATDNANELLDNLKIEFNKARQSAITQEITEIVSAANAL